MNATFASEQLSAQRLRESLAALQDEVRRDPSDAKKRIYLFQLLAVVGEWERAANQLDVCLNLNSECREMAEIYGPAIRAERTRQAVFSGAATPTIFGEPPLWTAKLAQAMRLGNAHDLNQAADLRFEAFDDAPMISGEINGEDFEWIGDADNRLGPVLEVILNGQYMWVPFDRIKTIRIEAPSDLRDLVWLPSMFTWTNGADIAGLIPSRYPGSEASEDDEIRLARRTQWHGHGDQQFIGLGQRMFATDSGEVSLLDVRSIEMKPSHA